MPILPKYAVSEVIGYLKGKSGAPRGASVAGSESLPKENSASCILDRVLGLQAYSICNQKKILPMR